MMLSLAMYKPPTKYITKRRQKENARKMSIGRLLFGLPLCRRPHHGWWMVVVVVVVEWFVVGLLGEELTVSLILSICYHGLNVGWRRVRS